MQKRDGSSAVALLFRVLAPFYGKQAKSHPTQLKLALPKILLRYI
ncbi:hypothetical protein [Rufibacter sp. XAAS-G3-1]|nr:hypothetical protein [Rufibacter sp. XAAS-G3-1]